MVVAQGEKQQYNSLYNDRLKGRGPEPQEEARGCRAASGVVIADQGEKPVTMWIEDGDASIMTFQIVDVVEPLASAGRIAAMGHCLTTTTTRTSSISRS